MKLKIIETIFYVILTLLMLDTALQNIILNESNTLATIGSMISFLCFLGITIINIRIIFLVKKYDKMDEEESYLNNMEDEIENDR